MNVYVFCEHYDSWRGMPEDMADILLGVFVSREDAEKCLWTHASYGYSSGLLKLILVAGNAQDAEGVIDFTIFEWELGACSAPVYE